jgi:hypothetical protein
MKHIIFNIALVLITSCQLLGQTDPDGSTPDLKQHEVVIDQLEKAIVGKQAELNRLRNAAAPSESLLSIEQDIQAKLNELETARSKLVADDSTSLNSASDSPSIILQGEFLIYDLELKLQQQKLKLDSLQDGADQGVFSRQDVAIQRLKMAQAQNELDAARSQQSLKPLVEPAERNPVGLTLATPDDISMQLDRESVQLAETLRDAKSKNDTETVARIEQELKASVEKAFAQRLQTQLTELEAAEASLQKVRVRLEKRKSLSKEIIERRYQELSDDDNTAWLSKTNGDATKQSVINIDSTTDTEMERTAKTQNAEGEKKNAYQRLRERSLSLEVRRFNEEAKNFFAGINTTPVTEDEVVAALRWARFVDRALDKKSSRFRDAVNRVIDKQMVPADFKLIYFSYVLGTKGPSEACDIWFVLEEGNSAVESLSIRKQHFHHPDPDNVRFSEQPPEADSLSMIEQIDQFNNTHSVINEQQMTRLTKKELVSAINAHINFSGHSKIPMTDIQRLLNHMDREQLPAGSKIELLPAFRPGDGYEYKIWSVRMILPLKNRDYNKLMETIIIRNQFIKAEPVDPNDVNSYGLGAAGGGAPAAAD